MRRRHALLALSGLAAAAAAFNVAAQDFPSRPIRLIVPFPPGSASDVISRLVADRLSPVLGQPVVVDNRPGAGGNIGSELGARAPADGHTLTIATAALPISKHVFRKLPFNPIADFAPVTLMTITPLVLVATPSLPVDSVRELVDYAKKNPNKINFASSGPGTSHHLSGELFKTLAGVDIVHVPFKGSAPAHIDLIAGNVSIMFDNIVPVLPQIKAGKLKALAVTTRTRAPLLPNIPTMEESGFPQFEAVAWFGVLAPAGTPQPVVQRLNREIVKVLNSPDVKSRLTEMGAQVAATTPAEFSRFLAAEVARWEPVVKRAKVVLD
jgi:tripartite-type tricarboxylate transporter receptor subunit TctC